MLKDLKFADGVTLLNAMCGLLSIFSSIQHNFRWAVIFMLLAAVFDALDGIVARLMKENNKIGIELDSLSDIISFGIAPAVFAYCLRFDTWWNVTILSLFIVAGVIRLAYFNINVEKNKGIFIGMPITTNAILVPLAALLIFDYLIFAVLLFAILMVLPFRIKKWSYG